MEDINRLKLLLVEKKKTSKWLSEQLGITPSTVSKDTRDRYLIHKYEV
jgi:DNA-binding Xre family transcriptional regulator